MKNSSLDHAIRELQTLRDMVRWGASQFNAANLTFGHGIDNAWDEAVFLARHALHLTPAEDDKAADAKLLISERLHIAQLFQRRISERKPAAYLTREAWFAGLPFYVDERVLIPRSPIAELIEHGFSPWLDETPITRVLDLCTGSGCIAIACALAFPEAEVDAVDICSEALEVAKQNIERHGVTNSVNLINSDLFSGLIPRSYDLIVSNPPYVNAEDMTQLPPEYHHEPIIALAAGEDGLDLVVRIITEAKHYLSPQGVLIVEVGNSAPALEARFPDLPLLWLEFKHGGHGVFVLTAEQLGNSKL
ncbi:MAG TPA: 50S ribosomal protein L3 N(5)-glutamine methyltransferase [Gammaproteobacteria bacterium]|nr:50S ribosomal protein L3 N(5)-glutamine methyltransferase [Gammaproteobacteria bacterium]